MSSPIHLSQPRSLLVAFVLEQTLGHVTHSANLQRLVPEQLSVNGTSNAMRIEFLPIPFEAGRFGRLPGWSNWTVRSAVRAHRALRAASRRQQRPFDAIFVHTQVPATLLIRRMSRTPTVVSLDATPKQYDDLGEFYHHEPGRRRVEAVKHRLHRACFERAAHVVTWSSWARDDLVSRYGIDRDRISVIPPGVDVERWTPRTSPPADGVPLQVLFVGGDLERKGGQLLIEVCRRLRVDPSVPKFELHLVTNADVEPEVGLVVHRGLTPNSEGLIHRFRSADVFCLPTYGDCLPMVLAEAGGCGLPIVSSDVGAISEIVRNDVNGLLIVPGDGDALYHHLHRLLSEPELRRRLGRESRELVLRQHNARTNAGKTVGIVADAVRCGPAVPPDVAGLAGHRG